jgi:pyruvate decarboxylase
MAITASEEIPVGLYLFRRIRELGCKTVQGLPGIPQLDLDGNFCVGDFNLAFLDLIKEVDGLKWSGNCNELNAAYSADGMKSSDFVFGG